MDTLPTLFKIVGPHGEPLNGGSGDWPLPCQHAASPANDGCYRLDHVRAGYGWGAPGDWRDVDGPLEACRVGLHLTDAAHLTHWIGHGRPCVIYRAETRGEVINAGDKYVARSVRLLPRSRPMPDFDAAERKRTRALNRAAKRLETAVPHIWRVYLQGGSRYARIRTLPAGHPGAVYVDRLTAAEADYQVAVRKAEDAYARAIADGARV